MPWWGTGRLGHYHNHQKDALELVMGREMVIPVMVIRVWELVMKKSLLSALGYASFAESCLGRSICVC